MDFDYHDSAWWMDSLDVDILVMNFLRMDLIRKVLTWIGIMNSLSLSFYLSLSFSWSLIYQKDLIHYYNQFNFTLCLVSTFCALAGMFLRYLWFISVRVRSCWSSASLVFYQIINRSLSFLYSQFERANVPNTRRTRVSSKPWFHIQTASDVWIRWRHRSRYRPTFDIK